MSKDIEVIRCSHGFIFAVCVVSSIDDEWIINREKYKKDGSTVELVKTAKTKRCIRCEIKEKHTEYVNLGVDLYGLIVEQKDFSNQDVRILNTMWHSCNTAKRAIEATIKEYEEEQDKIAKYGAGKQVNLF
jgi:hypothetical protein